MSTFNIRSLHAFVVESLTAAIAFVATFFPGVRADHGNGSRQEGPVRFANGRRVVFAGVAALLAAVAIAAAGGTSAAMGQDEPPPCFTCTAECEFDSSSLSCAVNGDAAIGGNSCRTSVYWLDPLETGKGFFICICGYSGGYCFLRSAMASPDREDLEQEAIAVVAAGRRLPADGLFFTAASAEQDEVVIRWKCDGQLVARLAVAEAATATIQTLGG